MFCFLLFCLFSACSVLSFVLFTFSWILRMYAAKMLWLDLSVKSCKREIWLSDWNFALFSNIPGGTLISPGASPAGNSLQLKLEPKGSWCSSDCNPSYLQHSTSVIFHSFKKPKTIIWCAGTPTHHASGHSSGFNSASPRPRLAFYIESISIIST